jgi:predicted phosphodiesterase
VIGDLHAPFARDGWLDFCKKIYKDYKCDYVVQIGDLLDQYAFTRYVRDPDAYGAKHEIELAREMVNQMYKAFPKGFVVLGNHDTRLAKRAAETGIPKWLLASYAELIGLPKNWNLGEEIEIDEVKYFHGEGLSANTELAVRKVGQSVVYGHTHKGSIAFKAMKKDLLFAMNVGCLIDQHAYAFEYAKHALEKSFIGVGVVIDGKQPILIPMPLKETVEVQKVSKKKRGRPKKGR